MGLFVDNRPLLDAYRRGERHAFEAVYDAYARKVVDVLRHGFQFRSRGRSMRFRGFSDPGELETFVQEVFLRAFSEGARTRYDGLRPFEPYLLRLTRNRVIDELRRRQTALERLVGPLEEGAEPMSDEPGPEQTVDAARAARLVRAFVAERNELERAFIVARFERDASLLATARELGITRMRARVLERRLLRDLEDHLRGAGYLDAPAALATFATVLL